MKLSKKVLIVTKQNENHNKGLCSENRVLYLDLDFPILEWNENVIVIPSLHRQLCRGNNKYIKITSEASGKSIYRSCFGLNAKNFTNEYIALTSDSVRKLKLSKEHSKGEVTVCIKSSWWLPFFWYHPFHATRISMRIGVISVIIGLVGVILSIISLCPEQCWQ